uniref:Uncharacterized protein n=1 Tax=Ciona intestinalis TaxID=7719 RepID=H2XXJ1_CIOIN
MWIPLSDLRTIIGDIFGSGHWLSTYNLYFNSVRTSTVFSSAMAKFCPIQFL